MRRWDGLIDGYVRYCEARGLKEVTISHRRRELERWGLWLKRRRPKVNLETVDSELLIRYIRSRTVFHSKATISGVVSVMKCMGEFLVEEGIWNKSPMRWIWGPKLNPRARIPKRIGAAHLTRLWDAIKTVREDYSRHQALALLSILYSTGLRRGELMRLDMEDWKRDEQLLIIDGEKTGMERAVPVSHMVRQCIEAYLPQRHNLLEKRGRVNERSLFVSRQGDRLSAQALGKFVHSLAHRAGVPLVTLHQFRHSCASDLLENGVSLPEVQHILGHAVIMSTMRYTHIADPQRRRAIDRHPINEFLQPSTRVLEGKVA